MSKIIKAINKMIENTDLITNVVLSEDEYFFLYNNKVKWSIIEEEDKDISLILYPNFNGKLDELANIVEWEHINMVTYNTMDFKTQEATETFNELLQIVKSKVFGVDNLLDEIIGDD
ncbi:hypothetical protein [Polaribacter ponticola]|uniref:DUF2750 domain-containing protein n=1 Tax=Polaribacter ponticola TaxID=2978475 RepID=A0ABT5S6N8_9FLAO|nr:hypothetical protein [Polaribacter sp. MSW5]MDD7913766.1 hypothetical protein [Polaribacter sp. MSW5]